MTFQSISAFFYYYYYEDTESSGVYSYEYYDAYVFINTNALSTTQLLYEIPENLASANPFNTSYSKDFSASTSTSGATAVPRFSASISGVTSSEQSYLLDFSSNILLVWGIGCTYGDISPYYAAGGLCSAAPTYLDASYDSTDFETGTKLVGTFTNKTTSGFVVSGNIWYNLVTIAGVTQYQTVYEGTYISQDNFY